MYLPRTLNLLEQKESGFEEKTIKDSELLGLAQDCPIVILAEAGMGKSFLINDLSNDTQFKTKTFSASAFLNKSISRLNLGGDEILLIDAFDEISTQKESSAIDDVLNKLNELSFPKLILTCRSIEWNSSNYSEIVSDYGNIKTASLFAFDKKDCKQYLLHKQLTEEKIDDLIETLDNNNLSSFYQNPRNLELLSQIDFAVNPIPQNKTELFDLASSNLWQETNTQIQKPLSTYSEEKILNCAGYIFATYLLTGKQFVVQTNIANTPDDAVNIYSLTDLFETELLEATLQTRLFYLAETDLLKPWHRSIAEFLGAKWLANQMSNPRVKRQLMPYLIIDNGVVASLRGLFAWLPTFNRNLTSLIIKTDPYGLIEYSDTGKLSDSDSKLLFNTLKTMSEKNPFFRKNDYMKQAKSEGLARKCLLKNIKEVLVDKQITFHFLSTILEVLHDANFINEIENELFDIVYDKERSYSLRYDALNLLHAKGLITQRAGFDKLIYEGSHSCVRLVFSYANNHGYNLLSDLQINSLLMKSYNFTKEKYVRDNIHPNNGSYFYFLNFPADRIINLLASFRNSILALKIPKNQYAHRDLENINELILFLIKRYIEEAQSTFCSLTFYKSITIFERFKTKGYNFEEDADFFKTYFENNPAEKLKIQKHILDNADEDFSFFGYARNVLSSLYPSLNDAKHLIPYLQGKPPTPLNLNIWKSLIRTYSTKDGLPNEVSFLTFQYVIKHQNLIPFIERQREKVIFEWQIEDENFRKKEERERKKRHQKLRDDLKINRNELEKGNHKYCFTPAEVLLRNFSDIPEELKHFNRLIYVYEESLTSSAIKGFEASLHKPVPTITELSELIDTKMPIEPVLIAGIYCRLLENKTLDDLTDEVILACAVTLDFNHFFYLIEDKHPKVEETIRQEVIDRGLKPQIIKEMFIPQFKNTESSIRGLHWVFGEQADTFSRETIANLLNTFPIINQDATRQFIATLVNHDELERIRDLFTVNANLFTCKDIKKFNKWLVLLSILDEKLFFENIPNVNNLCSLFWQFYDTYYDSNSIKNPSMSLELLSWIVNRFNFVFPNISRPSGVSSGNRNSWQASDFILFCLSQMSNILTEEAKLTLQKLTRVIHKSYQINVINYLAEQAVKMREANYQPIHLSNLIAIAQNEQPRNSIDLKNLTLELLHELQDRVKGSELDTYKAFYKDGNIKEPIEPHSENYCRDRLADLLKPYIESYSFRLDTEKDMPDDKRADLVCSNYDMQLPIEVKGQWHKDLWVAMNEQLGELYLKEYQSNHGIYLVFYFGDDATKKVTKHSSFNTKNAQELEDMLSECIDDQFKDKITVFVFDLSY